LTVLVRINHSVNDEQFKINYSFAIPPNRRYHLFRMQIDFLPWILHAHLLVFKCVLRWTLLYRIHFSSPITSQSKKRLFICRQRNSCKKLDSIYSLRLANAAPTYRVSKYIQSFLNPKIRLICQCWISQQFLLLKFVNCFALNYAQYHARAWLHGKKFFIAAANHSLLKLYLLPCNKRICHCYYISFLAKYTSSAMITSITNWKFAITNRCN